MSTDTPRAPAIGTLMRSLDPRGDGRTVRVIEHEMDYTGRTVRRLRVENTRTERRTFLRWPLASEWVYAGPGDEVDL